MSAALYSASLPPFDLSLLAWTALVPLLFSLVGAPLRWGFAIGWLWSLGVGCGTAFFVPGMLERYFELERGTAWFAAGAAILVPGLWYALFGAWLAARRGISPVGPFEIAGIWGGVEWARASLGIANPWSLSGYSQASVLPVLQGAGVFGVVGLGMLLALGNAALAMWHPALRPRRWRRSAIGVGIVLVAWFGFGVAQLSRSPEAGASLRVGLVQPDLSRSVRLDPSQERRVLARLIGLSRYAHARGAELILWPEYAIERVVASASSERREIDAFSAESGASLVVGMISAREHGFANSTLLIENGREAGRYDKVELMPFGEMRPLGGALGGHDFGLVAGVDRAPLASRVGRIGVLACNEVMSSAPARATTRAGAQLLANLANDEWFGRYGLRQQMRIATLRAVETRRYLVRATWSGITAVIDPFGRVVEEAGIDQAGVLVADVQLRDEPSLYVRWGDRPVQLAALAALAGGVIARARRDPRDAARA